MFITLIIKILLINFSKQMFENLKVKQIENQLELISVIKETPTKYAFFTLNTLGIIDMNSGEYEIKTSSLSLLNSTDAAVFSEGKYLVVCTQNNILEIISESGEILNYISYTDINVQLTITHLKCSISYKNNILLISYSIIDDSGNLNYTLLSYNIIDENNINLINRSTMHQIIGLLRTNYPYYFFCYLTEIPCCIYKSSQKNLAYLKLTSNYELDNETFMPEHIDSNVYEYNDFKISYIGDDTFISFIFCSRKPYLNGTIVYSKNPNVILKEHYIVKSTYPDYDTWNGNSYTGNPNFILGIYYSDNQLLFENLIINENEKIYESNGIIYYRNDIGCSQIYSIYINNGKFFIMLRGSIISTTLEYFIYEIPEKYCTSNYIKSYSQEKIRFDGSQLFSSFDNNEEIFYYDTTYNRISISDNKYIIIDNNEDYGSYTFSIGIEKKLSESHYLILKEKGCIINYYICHEKCAYCDKSDFIVNGIYSNCSSKRCKDNYYYDVNDNTNCILKTSLENRCYETCNTCSNRGNNAIQNCLSCKYDLIFDGVENTNCIYCKYGNNLWYYNKTIDSYLCTILGDGENCPSKYKYIINDLNECVITCPNNYKYIYEKKCYSNCPVGTKKDPNSNNCCLIGYEYFAEGDICCLEGSKYFTEGSRCCNRGYYYNKTGDTCCPNNYIWDPIGVCCPNGYRADTISKVCCPIGQTYNRKDLYCCPYGSTYNEISEICECDYYYYYDLNNNNKQVCLIRNECYNNNYPLLIENSFECVKECNEEHKYIVNNTFTCISECPYDMYHVSDSYLCSSSCKDMYIPNGIECVCGHYLKKRNNYQIACVPHVNTSQLIESSKTIDELIDNVEKYIDQYLDNGETVNSRNISIKVLNSSDEDIDINAGSNLSSIFLGECETILKNHYHLKPDDPLIILQVDITPISGMANKVEYRVYDQNYNMLDLSLCDKSSVSIYYGTNENVNIELVELLSQQGVDIFDKNSDFYNSRCISFSIGDNDVSISDRQKSVYNNISVCEVGCNYVSYNNETKRVKCDCDVKNQTNTTFSDVKKEADNFFDSINNQINYKIVLCYIVFKKILKEFYYNIGFWLYIFCLFIFIFCKIHYICIGKTVLNSKINAAYKKPVYHKHVRFSNLPNPPHQKNNNNNSINDNNNNNKNNTNNDKDNLSQFNSSVNLNKEEDNIMNNKENKLLLKNSNINSKNNSFNLKQDEIKNKNKNLSFINPIPEIKDNDENNRVIIYLSKEDPLTKMKEYDISINPSNQNNSPLNSNLKEINIINDNKNTNNIIFDSKINKIRSRNINKNIDLTNYLSGDLLQTNIGTTISFNSKIKKNEDRYSMTAINQNKQEPSFIKVSTNRNFEIDNLETENNFFETKEEYYKNQIKRYSKYRKVYFKNDDDEHNYQEMTFLQALEYDKRNFFRTFSGIFFIKVELISTLFFPEPFALFSITIPIYLLGILIDFTLNALMYTDDIVSQKYSNEGKLALYTSIILGTISNFITFLIMKNIRNWLNYSYAFEHIGVDIKNEIHYFKKVKIIFSFIKKRIFIYFFIELIISAACGYYIYIFCNIYKKSQFSMVLNYLIGLGESLLISLVVTLFVSIMRLIALRCKIKGVYYSSRYLSELI